MKKGSRGENVKELQRFLNLDADGIFGTGTEKAVILWQNESGLNPDGIVGSNTIKRMGLKLIKEKFDEKYKGITIEGSHFPDKPIKSNLRIKLTDELISDYLPIISKKDIPKGFKLLCIIMAHKEGFKKGTRSYETNNPGNIGNTDTGKNKKNLSLEDGINIQLHYIFNIISGNNKAYPIGKRKVIKPYFSKEIARNAKTYGMSPFVPGYRFIFTGQLDQFVKIYSTGARAGNGYLSMIISYFKQNGFDINEKTKIQDIVTLN